MLEQIKLRYKYVLDEDRFYDAKRRVYFNEKSLRRKLVYKILCDFLPESISVQNLIDEIKAEGKIKSEVVRKVGRPLKAG